MLSSSPSSPKQIVVFPEGRHVDLDNYGAVDVVRLHQRRGRRPEPEHLAVLVRDQEIHQLRLLSGLALLHLGLEGPDLLFRRLSHM